MTKDLPPYGVGRFVGRYPYLEVLRSSLFFDGGTTVSRALRTDSSSYVASHRPPAEFCLVEGGDPGVACGLWLRCVHERWRRTARFALP